MGQYTCHVFVCTSGDTCPQQGDVEKFVKTLRTAVATAGKHTEVRINKAGCFSQCGHGPMIVTYPDNVWYHGVQESDLAEIFQSHILDGKPVARLVYDPGVPGANKVPAVPAAKPAGA
jgi:(2Fe-2S) ferredoxin